MESDEDKTARTQRHERRKPIAMTRAINMVSEEFIENYSQTGKDDGPEVKAKASPVREALNAREQRESLEEQKAAAQPEFRGFAALMANANNPAKASAFSRLLSEEQEQLEAAETQSPDGSSQSTTAGPQASPQTNTRITSDGATIKVKDTVGKKRGLYTSCMQQPTAEQMQEMAVKYARPATKAIPETPVESQVQHMPDQVPDPIPNRISQHASVITEVDKPRFGHCEVRRPTPMKSKMTYESSCPFACAFSKLIAPLASLGQWLKSKLGR